MVLQHTLLIIKHGTFKSSLYHVVTKRKGKVCGSCDGCTKEDCAECKVCLDKPRFEGHGGKIQWCVK